jgi:rhodanese-related sulfurtransferase
MIRGVVLFVILLFIAVGIIPIMAYWAVVGRLPTFNAVQAIRLLNQPDGNAVLVDIQPPSEYALQHVVGAFNWPLDRINAFRSTKEMPAELQNKTVLLVCSGGWESVKALYHLQSISFSNVYNIRGGLQEWAKAGYRLQNMNFSHFTGQGKSEYLLFQPMSLIDQTAQALAGLVVKPLYMLISLVLASALIRQNATDLAALGWGMLIFFIGELFCYINFFFFRDDSYLAEYLHSYGMIVSFGFVFFALMEGIEVRLFHFNTPDKKCAAIALCKVCAKNQAVTCRAQRLYQLVIPSLALVSTIPFSARFDLQGFTGLVFTLPYYYSRFSVYQFYENRLLPILAILFFAGAYLPLWLKNAQPVPRLTHILFSAGLGAISFAWFRLSFGMIFASNQVWFAFWEEMTELLFVTAILVILWIFRRTLFPGSLRVHLSPLVKYLS